MNANESCVVRVADVTTTVYLRENILPEPSADVKGGEVERQLAPGLHVDPVDLAAFGRGEDALQGGLDALGEADEGLQLGRQLDRGDARGVFLPRGAIRSEPGASHLFEIGQQLGRPALDLHPLAAQRLPAALDERPVPVRARPGVSRRSRYSRLSRPCCCPTNA